MTTLDSLLRHGATTEGKSGTQKCGTLGSVRGAAREGGSYRDRFKVPDRTNTSHEHE